MNGLNEKRPGVRLGLALLLVLAALRAEAQDQTAPDDAPPTAPPTATQPSLERGLALGDEQDIALLEMEVPVVVTAARREEKLMAVPYAVSVITAEDIRRSGARSVPEVLRLVPGVDVAALSANNVAACPRGIHGLTSRMLHVLVDGRQLFDSFFGGLPWGYWPFQLEDIERIEVIRGPGGVTWGANAVNGVINIITKDPRDQRGITFIGGGGSRGFQHTHLSYGYADDRLRLRVSGEYEACDGFVRGGSLLRVLDDDYRAGRMGLHAIYTPTELDTLTFSAGSGLFEDGMPPSPMVLFSGRRSGAQANFVLGRWTRQVSPDNTFEITAYLNDVQLSPGIQSIDYRYQQYALQYGHTLKLGGQHTLTWGIDTRLDYVDTSNSDPVMLDDDYVTSGTVGLYLQDQWQFAPRWSLHLGGRIDYDTYGGFEPSARAALSYELAENHFMYGAVSRAFQMAPAAYRLAVTPFVEGLTCLTSDRDLDPITLLAYELGYRGRYFEKLDLSANLFWHEYADLVTASPEPGPPGLLRLHSANRAAGSLYGVELEGRYRATEALTLSGNYTFQVLDWRSDTPYHYTDTMTAPHHKFMVGACYDLSADFHLCGNLYFVDKVWAPRPEFPFVSREIDRYFRLDLQAEYEFWQDRAALCVGVHNLLDNHHREGASLFINDGEVPRMVYASLRLYFK